jgi:hypothetical protein
MNMDKNNRSKKVAKDVRKALIDINSDIRQLSIASGISYTHLRAILRPNATINITNKSIAKLVNGLRLLGSNCKII